MVNLPLTETALSGRDFESLSENGDWLPDVVPVAGL
jgi:hypothetical protein